MIVTHKVDVFACLNCDGVQPQEVGLRPRDRVRTPRDRKYADEMEKRQREWYPKIPKNGDKA